MKLFSAAPLAFLLSVASILASPVELRDAKLHDNSGIYGSGRNQIAERAVTNNVDFNAQVEHAALQLKQHKAQEFCSRYLHISPYAATATKFATVTATAIVPGPALTQLVHITVTKTAPASFLTKTTLSVVDYVLTATQTQIDVVPTTVTVATVTSLTTVELATIVGTVTILTPAIETVIPRAARQTGTPTTSAARTCVKPPPYLLGTPPAIISRACSRIVTPKTTTITATRTVTNTITKKASTVRATITDQPVVTPTSTRFVPSISTRTVGTVVVPVTKTSLTTIPATVTNIRPTTILIPTSTTIYLPSPTPSLPRGYLRVRKVSDNSVFGLVRTQLDSQYSYTYTPDTSGAGALVVTLPEGWMYGRLMDLNTRNGDATYPRIGGVGGSGGYNFRSNFGYAYLAPVNHADVGTQTNAHAITRLGYNAPAESQIWILNQDLSVTATWTEPATGGTSAQAVSTTLFYDPTVDYVGIVNNLVNFLEVYPGAFAVTLEFVPIDPLN